MNSELVAAWLKKTELLQSPSRPLATFGATRIPYSLISPVEDLKDRTRLREGTVLSKKPLILTPQAFAERFEGFGEEAQEAARWLTSAYKDLLRALEYNFKNEDFTTRVISNSPKEVADSILKELEKEAAPDRAVILCPDGAWALALMKFTLDQAGRSFPGQIKELERRGYFEPGGPVAGARRREIERLFTLAAEDPEARAALGKKLKDWGLWPDFEDRFLALF